ncbi:MAG: 16S rRNA (uracil(1498)-N(3))-methyltransferase [Flavobacteriales bacterium]|nr:16S rRNA (uracil(1498)-N(3))-methyltransferase [Flavobacteriales bacterium]
MRRFYAPEVKPGPHSLGADEARHLGQVLRARPGDAVELADGQGAVFPAEVVSVGKREAVLQVGIPACFPIPDPQLTLWVAPTKHTDRFEWFLEKACECGVSRIQPIWTGRSERKVEKHERWHRTLVEAMKQSQRAWLPELLPATPLKEALETVKGAVDGPWLGLAHCPVPEHPEWQRQSITEAMPAGSDAVLAIGPEGDFTPDEIEAFGAAGFTPVTMGTHRLRTETAALYAVQAFHLINALK